MRKIKTTMRVYKAARTIFFKQARLCVILAALLFARIATQAQETGQCVISERSDFSKYENTRYVGHVYRETKTLLSWRVQGGGETSYTGETFLLGETRRNMRPVAARLEGTLPVVFNTRSDGSTVYADDCVYPLIRGMPGNYEDTCLPGSSWSGHAVIVVQAQPERNATRIPVLVEYTCAGETPYNGSSARLIKARYAVRYDGGDAAGDPDLRSVSGTRSADIVVDKKNGALLYIRELVDETYRYADAPSVRLRGFILHFYSSSPQPELKRIADRLSDDAAQRQPELSRHETDSAYYEVQTTQRGVTLLLYGLRFEPDSDVLLQSESARLDAIALALKRLPEKKFLVEGHAADAGRPSGQYALSEQRARRIVHELCMRGLDEGRFLYRGLGADMPIAPNDTEQNRAKNRRVEILIID